MTSQERALAITGSFEGCSWGGLTGNFDGQGFSAFIISWAMGQGTLQGVIKAMHAAGPDTFKRCCSQPVAQEGGKVIDLSGELLAACDLPAAHGVEWARARQDAHNVPFPHWKAVFHALGEEPGFRAVQLAHCAPYFTTARSIMAQAGVSSERALALAFDIAVQCGSVTTNSWARYKQRCFTGMTEQEKLVALAQAVAPQGGQWEADVRSRKMCIAAGRGEVHGATYDLAKQFGLGDGPVVA